MDEMLKKRKICIFGCGKYGKRLYRRIKSTDTTVSVIFCDNDDSKYSDGEYEIIPPAVAADQVRLQVLDSIYIPGASSDSIRLAMINQLLQFRVDVNSIYIADICKTINEPGNIQLTSLTDINLVDMYAGIERHLGWLASWYDELNWLHEDVVESVWSGDNTRRQYICMFPFYRIEIREYGVYTCCPAHLKYGYSIGSPTDDFKSEIWNSNKAKRIRYSVLHGNYEYCTRLCPFFNNPTRYPSVMIPRSRILSDPSFSNVLKVSKWQDCSWEQNPTYIYVSCDTTCNLYCASCRTKVMVNSDEYNSRVTSILENTVRPMLHDCENLRTNGSGEFFTSKPLQQFYRTLSPQEYPNLRLSIITNGQLFTPERWGKFSNLKGMVDSIDVSIDAAKKTTYEKLRRGGKWEILCRNMEYISSLKASSEINHIILRFVVQKENYNEIEDFIELAHKWHADGVSFSKLINIGAYSHQLFISQNVLHPLNPLNAEVRHRLQEIKRKSKIQLTGNCFIE